MHIRYLMRPLISTQAHTDLSNTDNENNGDELDGEHLRSNPMLRTNLKFVMSSSYNTYCKLSHFVDQMGEDEEAEGIVLQQYPWEGSDRDYEYEEVILKEFSYFGDRNEDLLRTSGKCYFAMWKYFDQAS